MLHALTLALADTLNFLLIGVLIAVGLAQTTREKGDATVRSPDCSSSATGSGC